MAVLMVDVRKNAVLIHWRVFLISLTTIILKFNHNEKLAYPLLSRKTRNNWLSSRNTAELMHLRVFLNFWTLFSTNPIAKKVSSSIYFTENEDQLNCIEKLLLTWCVLFKKNRCLDKFESVSKIIDRCFWIQPRRAASLLISLTKSERAPTAWNSRNTADLMRVVWNTADMIPLRVFLKIPITFLLESNCHENYLIQFSHKNMTISIRFKKHRWFEEVSLKERWYDTVEKMS